MKVIALLWRVLPGHESRLSEARDAFNNELRRLWLSRPLSPVRCSEKVREDAKALGGDLSKFLEGSQEERS